jgi:hypothetical protein
VVCASFPATLRSLPSPQATIFARGAFRLLEELNESLIILSAEFYDSTGIVVAFGSSDGDDSFAVAPDGDHPHPNPPRKVAEVYWTYQCKQLLQLRKSEAAATPGLARPQWRWRSFRKPQGMLSSKALDSLAAVGRLLTLPFCSTSAGYPASVADIFDFRQLL